MTDPAEAAKDWKDIVDVKKRRKIQNRINQRASRRRKISQTQLIGSVRKWTIYVDATQFPSEEEPEKNQTISRLCDLDPIGRQVVLKRLHDHVSQGIMAGALTSDLLLSVTQFNTIRAMIANAASMGLTMEILQQDIASPFNAAGPWEMTITNLPFSLQPTQLQRTIVHHPWIDLCPVASIRDALLRNSELYDDDELCGDLFNDHDSQVGLITWGEAWDPIGYEISEKMMSKWSWIWDECPEIILSTNYWRLKRGEQPLLINIKPGGKKMTISPTFAPTAL